MRCLGVVIMVVLLVGSGAGQDLSSLVLPSEDELLEALREGEIDYEQYLLLQEYLAFGIAPWEDYLFDEIPNLSLKKSTDTLNDLEVEQARPFRNLSELRPGFSGQVSHRAGVEANGEKRTRYRSSVRLSLDGAWILRGQIQREYTGRERVTQRSVEYHKKGGGLRRMVAGNFSERFGLGTVVGRRGKLLDYDSRLSRESWLYPDNGSYNGALLEGRSGSIGWKGLLSHVRDTAFGISNAAGMVSMHAGRFEPSIILGTVRLQNRITDHVMLLYMLGLNLRVVHRHGGVEAEVVGQSGEGTSSVSGVLESRAAGEWGDLRFSGWTYSDAYQDITSGSRSSRVYRNCTDDETEFSYSSRRCGQSGALVKYTTEPLPKFALNFGLAYGGVNADTSMLELTLGVAHQVSKKFTLGAAVEERRLRKFQVDAPSENDRRKTRLEARYADRRIKLRGYVGYATQTDAHDYWLLFLSASVEDEMFGKLEIWSNFGRIEVGTLAYWYGFIRHEQELFDHFSVGVKLAQSYRRTDVPTRNTTLVLEAMSRF